MESKGKKQDKSQFYISKGQQNNFQHLTFFSKGKEGMNFLAHLYLSGDDEKLLTGNFIGDYVKGKNFLKYPGKIREGILLHRRIDSFTDTHPQFREVKVLFRGEFGLYSGVVTDLIFDHLLACQWEKYSNESLSQFAKKVHEILQRNFMYLPPRVQGFLPVLIKNRRLESYAQVDGIHQSLDIMSRYTSLPEKAGKAIETMQSNYEFIDNRFSAFIHELIKFSEQETGRKIKNPAGGAGSLW